jgi:hypothetical protein
LARYKNKTNKPFKSSIKTKRKHGNDKNAYRRLKQFRRKLKSKEKRRLKNRIDSFNKSNLNNGIWKKKTSSPHYQTKVTYEPNVELFCQQNTAKHFKQFRGRLTLTKDFSLHDNPNRVLTTLLRILYNAKQKRNYTKVEYTGSVSFGALYLLDAVCWEIASKRPKWWLQAENMSNRNYEIQSKLKSFKTGDIDTKDAYIYNNKIQINREDNKLAKQRHKEASKTVRGLINKGIENEIKQTHKLDYNEVAAIESAITEHFDNILLHVPSAKYGHLCTFFDRGNKTVTILIFNYGHTIASTLEKNDIPEEVQLDIDKVVNNHKQKGFLGLGSSFTAENALTLLAIQEGISSKLENDDSRGHGIIDYIKHCKKMSSDSKITIISGKTAIKIDNSCDITRQNVFGRPRKIIALNKENDIMQKPDDKHVEGMQVSFPGVIIETVIPINIS